MLTGKLYTINNEQDVPLLKLYHSAVMPEKRGYRNHHHAEFEIGLIKAGTGIYKVGDREYPIQKGDIFLFSTDEHHCITEISGNEEMLIMNIQFAPRLIWSQSGVFNTELLKIFLERKQNFSNRLESSAELTARVRSLMLDAEKEFVSGKAQYELMVKINLLSILVELTRGLEGRIYETEIGAKSASFEKMSKTMDYIDNNISKDLQLSELAEIAGMNKSYFSTLFKKLNGMSPWDYITVRRIDLARRLLSDSDRNILDIAMLCGFNNTANFNRAFKKVTGKTPKEIRK